MATEADIPEPVAVSLMEREVDRNLNPGEFDHPPEIAEFLVKSGLTGVLSDVEVKTTNSWSEANAGTIGGESFSESPSIPKVPEEGTTETEETCQEDEIPCQSEKKMVEIEERIRQDESVRAKENEVLGTVEGRSREISDASGFSLKQDKAEEPCQGNDEGKTSGEEKTVDHVEVNKQVLVEENPNSTDKETLLSDLQKEEEEGKKELDTNVEKQTDACLENEEKGPDLAQQNESEKDGIKHDQAVEDSSMVEKCIQIQGNEEASSKIVNNEEENLGVSSVTLAVDNSGIEQAVVEAGEKLEGKSNVEISTAPQTEEVCLQEADKAEICEVVSETCNEDHVKKIQEESQDGMVEKTLEAESSKDKTGQDEKNPEVDRNIDEEQGVSEALAEQSKDETKHTVKADEDRESDSPIAPERSVDGPETISKERDTIGSRECPETVIYTKEHTFIENQEESFAEKDKGEESTDTEAIRNDRNPSVEDPPPTEIHESVEISEVELLNKNECELNVVHSAEQETAQVEGEELGEVHNFKPGDQINETNEAIMAEEEHDKGNMQATDSTEIASGTGTRTTEARSDAKETETGISEVIQIIDSGENLEIVDFGKGIEKDVPKFPSCENAAEEASINEDGCTVQAVSVQEEATPVKDETEESEEARNTITEKVTGILDVDDELNIRDNAGHFSSEVIDEKAVGNPQQSEKEVDAFKVEDIESVSQESVVEEVGIKSLQDDKKDTQKSSSREIVEEYEVSETIISNANETKHSDESPDPALQCSLDKEQENLKSQNLATLQQAPLVEEIDEDGGSSIKKEDGKDDYIKLEEGEEQNDEVILKSGDGPEHILQKNEPAENAEEPSGLSKMNDNTLEVAETEKEEILHESNNESLLEKTENFHNSDSNAEISNKEIIVESKAQGTADSVADVTNQNNENSSELPETSASAKDDTAFENQEENTDKKEADEKLVDVDANRDDEIQKIENVSTAGLDEISGKNADELKEIPPQEQEPGEAQDQAHKENEAAVDEEEGDENDSQACKSTKNTNLEHPFSEGEVIAEPSPETREIDNENLERVHGLDSEEKCKDAEMTVKEEACETDMHTLAAAATSDNSGKCQVTSDNICNIAFSPEIAEKNFQAASIPEAPSASKDEVEFNENSSNIQSEKILDIGQVTDEQKGDSVTHLLSEVSNEEKVEEDSVTHLSSEVINDEKVESTQQSEKKMDVCEEEDTDGQIIQDNNYSGISQEQLVGEDPVKISQIGENTADKSGNREMFEKSDATKTGGSTATEAKQRDQSPDFIEDHESQESQKLVAVETSSVAKVDEAESSIIKDDGGKNELMLRGEEDLDQKLQKNEAEENMEEASNMISTDIEGSVSNLTNDNTVEKDVESPKCNQRETESEKDVTKSNTTNLPQDPVDVDKANAEISEKPEIDERTDGIATEAKEGDENPEWVREHETLQTQMVPESGEDDSGHVEFQDHSLIRAETEAGASNDEAVGEGVGSPQCSEREKVIEKDELFINESDIKSHSVEEVAQDPVMHDDKDAEKLNLEIDEKSETTETVDDIVTEAKQSDESPVTEQESPLSSNLTIPEASSIDEDVKTIEKEEDRENKAQVAETGEDKEGTKQKNEPTESIEPPLNTISSNIEADDSGQTDDATMEDGSERPQSSEKDIEIEKDEAAMKESNIESLSHESVVEDPVRDLQSQDLATAETLLVEDIHKDASSTQINGDRENDTEMLQIEQKENIWKGEEGLELSENIVQQLESTSTEIEADSSSKVNDNTVEEGAEQSQHDEAQESVEENSSVENSNPVVRMDTKEVLQDIVESDASNLVENAENDIPAKADENEEEMKLEMQDKALIARDDDQNEIITGKMPSDEVLDDNLTENSETSSKVSELITMDKSQSVDEISAKAATANENREIEMSSEQEIAMGEEVAESSFVESRLENANEQAELLATEAKQIEDHESLECNQRETESEKDVNESISNNLPQDPVDVEKSNAEISEKPEINEKADGIVSEAKESDGSLELVREHENLQTQTISESSREDDSGHVELQDQGVISAETEAGTSNDKAAEEGVGSPQCSEKEMEIEKDEVFTDKNDVKSHSVEEVAQNPVIHDDKDAEKLSIEIYKKFEATETVGGIVTEAKQSDENPVTEQESPLSSNLTIPKASSIDEDEKDEDRENETQVAETEEQNEVILKGKEGTEQKNEPVESIEPPLNTTSSIAEVVDSSQTDDSTMEDGGERPRSTERGIEIEKDEAAIKESSSESLSHESMVEDPIRGLQSQDLATAETSLVEDIHKDVFSTQVDRDGENDAGPVEIEQEDMIPKEEAETDSSSKLKDNIVEEGVAQSQHDEAQESFEENSSIENSNPEGLEKLQDADNGFVKEAPVEETSEVVDHHCHEMLGEKEIQKGEEDPEIVPEKVEPGENLGQPITVLPAETETGSLSEVVNNTEVSSKEISDSKISERSTLLMNENAENPDASPFVIPSKEEETRQDKNIDPIEASPDEKSKGDGSSFNANEENDCQTKLSEPTKNSKKETLNGEDDERLEFQEKEQEALVESSSDGSATEAKVVNFSEKTNDITISKELEASQSIEETQQKEKEDSFEENLESEFHENQPGKFVESLPEVMTTTETEASTLNDKDNDVAISDEAIAIRKTEEPAGAEKKRHEDIDGSKVEKAPTAEDIKPADEQCDKSTSVEDETVKERPITGEIEKTNQVDLEEKLDLQGIEMKKSEDGIKEDDTGEMQVDNSHQTTGEETAQICEGEKAEADPTVEMHRELEQTGIAEDSEVQTAKDVKVENDQPSEADSVTGDVREEMQETIQSVVDEDIREQIIEKSHAIEDNSQVPVTGIQAESALQKENEDENDNVKSEEEVKSFASEEIVARGDEASDDFDSLKEKQQPDDDVSDEPILPKECNESLVEESFPASERKEDIIGKSASVTRETEETSFEEIDLEDKRQLDSYSPDPQEKESTVVDRKEVLEDIVESDASKLIENTENDIPAKANENKEEMTLEIQDKALIAGDDDQNEVITGRLPSEEVSDDNLMEHSEMLSKLSELITMEKVQSVDEISAKAATAYENREIEMSGEQEITMGEEVAESSFVESGLENANEQAETYQSENLDLQNEQSLDKPESAEIPKVEEPENLAEEREICKPKVLEDEEASNVADEALKSTVSINADRKEAVLEVEDLATKSEASLKEVNTVEKEAAIVELRTEKQEDEVTEIKSYEILTEKNTEAAESSKEDSSTSEILTGEPSNEKIPETESKIVEECSISESVEQKPQEPEESQQKKEDDKEAKFEPEDYIIETPNEEEEIVKTVILTEEVQKEIEKADGDELIKQFNKEENDLKEQETASNGERIDEATESSSVFTKDLEATGPDDKTEMAEEVQETSSRKEKEETEAEVAGVDSTVDLFTIALKKEDPEEVIKEQIVEDTDYCFNKEKATPMTEVITESSLDEVRIDDKAVEESDLLSDDSNLIVVEAATGEENSTSLASQLPVDGHENVVKIPVIDPTEESRNVSDVINKSTVHDVEKLCAGEIQDEIEEASEIQKYEVDEAVARSEIITDQTSPEEITKERDATSQAMSCLEETETKAAVENLEENFEKVSTNENKSESLLNEKSRELGVSQLDLEGEKDTSDSPHEDHKEKGGTQDETRDVGESVETVSISQFEDHNVASGDEITTIPEELGSSTEVEKTEKKVKGEELLNDEGKTSEEIGSQKEESRELQVSELELDSPNVEQQAARETSIDIEDTKDASELMSESKSAGQEETPEQKQISSFIPPSREQQDETSVINESIEEKIKEADASECKSKVMEETCLRKEEPRELEISILPLQLDKNAEQERRNELYGTEDESKDGTKQATKQVPESAPASSFQENNAMSIEKSEVQIQAASADLLSDEQEHGSSTVAASKEEKAGVKVPEDAQNLSEEGTLQNEEPGEVKPSQVELKLDNDIHEKSLEELRETEGGIPDEPVKLQPEHENEKTDAVTMVLMAEENQRERTINETEFVHVEVIKEEVKEENDDANNRLAIAHDEPATMESHRELKLKDERSSEDELLAKKTENEVQCKETEKTNASEMAEKQIENETPAHPHRGFVQSETATEPLPSVAGGENAEVEGRKLTNEFLGDSDGTISGDSRTDSATVKELDVDISRKETRTSHVEAADSTPGTYQEEKTPEGTSENLTSREAEPEAKIPIIKEDVPQALQEPVLEIKQVTEVKGLHPANSLTNNSEPNQHGVETLVYEDDGKGIQPKDSAKISLSDITQLSTREKQPAEGLTEEKEQISATKEETANRSEDPEKAKPDGEEEAEAEEEHEGEEEHRKNDSGSDAPVMVEASGDIDIKIPHKKSHNILSGVGSKVKHSIIKVKKAITGKSSHSKQQSPK